MWRASTKVNLLRFIGVILLLGGCYVISKVSWLGDKPEQQKAKSHINSLHVALELYKGKYGEVPPYLLGGDKEGWDYYNAHRPEGAPYLCDPLIASGLYESYPVNPYFHLIPRWGTEADQAAIKKFQTMIKGPDGTSFDPRFGMHGDKMGNVLAEPIYILTAEGDFPAGYPRMCPGQFYYQPYDEVGMYRHGFPEAEWGKVQWAKDYHPDFGNKPRYKFVIGLFGSVRTPGEDTIRWTDMSAAIPGSFPYISPVDKYSVESLMDPDVYLRLPEVVGGGDETTPPIWLADAGYSQEPTAPDGIPDGVIKWITNECD